MEALYRLRSAPNKKVKLGSCLAASGLMSHVAGVCILWDSSMVALGFPKTPCADDTFLFIVAFWGGNNWKQNLESCLDGRKPFLLLLLSALLFYEVRLLQVPGRRWPLPSFQVDLTSTSIHRQKLNDSLWILTVNSWDKESVGSVRSHVHSWSSWACKETWVLYFLPHNKGSSPM